jgi:DNA-directed RNA polymerase specialized sigma24 family protein
VIYMSFYEGRSHSEIADRLMIPLGSVKSRIRLAAEKLKLTLRGEISLGGEQ